MPHDAAPRAASSVADPGDTTIRSYRIGTAGWSIPARLRETFAKDGSGLANYASRLDLVEINSSFYRPHKPETWARWADTTPPDFRFTAKIPQSITHELRFARARAPLDRFLAEVGALGDKLGALLVQLPASFAWDTRLADRFFALFRSLHAGAIVVEPRHRSWFSNDAMRCFAAHDIGRVAADPAVRVDAAIPIPTRGIAYFRLHGAPRIYWSPYDDARLDALARDCLLTREEGATPWVIFDNTASQAALPNALALQERLRAST